MKSSLKAIHFSDEAKCVLHAVRKKIEDYNATTAQGKRPLYVSDRRWQKIARILKMAALLCDRKQVLPVDLMILSDCLWNDPEQRDAVSLIVRDAVREFCGYRNDDFDDWQHDLAEVEKTIGKTLYYSADEFNTKLIGSARVKCFPCAVKVSRIDLLYPYGHKDDVKDVYIPVSRKGTSGMFHPLDVQGNEDMAFNCDFKGSGKCHVEGQSVYTYPFGKVTSQVFVPEILHKNGQCREVTPAVKRKLRLDVEALRKELDVIREDVEARQTEVEKGCYTPFVPGEGRNVATGAYRDYIGQMDKSMIHVKRLLEKIDSHVD